MTSRLLVPARKRGLVCFVTLAAALLGWVVPGAASAAGIAKYSLTGTPYAVGPSPTEAWTPCAPANGQDAECELIVAPRPSVLTGVSEYGGSGELGGLDPKDLRSAYKLPAKGGSTQTVAIVDAYNDPDAESDLSTYRKHYELPECTEANGCFKKVNASGETKNYPTNNANWGLEISLDVDMVSAACNECHILLVEAANEEKGSFGAAEEEAVKLGATEISNSWNLGFEGSEAGEVGTAEETEFDKYLDHPGVPIFFSGGDYGYSVRYPAISQYAIAVGGTTLTKEAKAPREWTEKVWSNPGLGYRVKGRGTGSGCSKYEPKPKFQAGSTFKPCAGRIETDVSADADWVNSPVSLYDSYESAGWEVNGGTSASSPFVAGVEGLDSSFARAIGAEAFYKRPSSFFDITEGNNGTCTPPTEDTLFCTAEVGYDGPTGVGTPDGIIESTSFAPTAITEAASKVAVASATLNAAVNPENLSTEYYFEYGPTISYGTKVPVSPAKLEAGTSYKEVSEAVTALTENTTYHFRIVATNSDGTTYGLDQTLLTRTKPFAETKPATSVGETTATLNGMVNPEGEETKYYFEYGTTESYGTKTTEAGAGSGTSNVEESAGLTGLTLGTKYDFRIVATNGEVTSYGKNQTFTPSAKPVVHTEPAEEAGETTATLYGTVNPKGLETQYYFEYGTTEAYGSKTAEASAGSGTGSKEYGKAITGLKASTTYHFRVVATNGDGTTDGLDKTFSTTGKPSAETRPPTAISETEAKLSGIVNPRGLATKYYFETSTSESFSGAHKTGEVNAGSGAVNLEESITVTGLTPKQTIYFRIVATNSAGTTKGSGLATPLQFAPSTKQRFIGSVGTFEISTYFGLVTCASGTASGEITGTSTLGRVVMTFIGCKGQRESEKCEVGSEGAHPGEIVTYPLKGELGTVITKEAVSGVGLLLKAESAPENTLWWRFNETPCDPGREVYGQLAAEVVTIGKRQLHNTLVFKQVAGIKEITVGSGEKEYSELESYLSSSVFLEGTNSLTFEKEVEVT